MALLVNAAYILILLSFSVRNMLWLRALNVIAGMLFICSFSLLEEPLWSAIIWNALFGVVNVTAIAREIASRRLPALDAREQALHHAHFSTLPLHPYRALLDLATWETIDSADTLCAAGEAPGRLWFLVEGSLEASTRGSTQRAISAGDFIGEGSFLTGQPLDESVSNAAGEVTLLSWPVEQLRKLMGSNQALGEQLQRRLGTALMQRLSA